MTYAIIGTGNTAWLFATRMLSAGHTCVGVWGRNDEATHRLCAEYYLPRLVNLSDIHDGPDVCIVAVSDTAIADVVKGLSFKTTTLIHTAGSVDIDVVAARSINSGVVWPVYSIRKDSLPPHRSFPAIIEASNPDALSIVRQIGRALCDTTYEATGEQRRTLHLAAVMGNNFVNHLLAIATDICAEQGLPKSLLQPLIEQSIAAIRNNHPALLQTGPARRGDTATMQGHLSMLHNHPEWQSVYTAISNSIMEHYKVRTKD